MTASQKSSKIALALSDNWDAPRAGSGKVEHVYSSKSSKERVQTEYVNH